MTRLLGLDIGERRIGVSVSDPTGTLARPLRTIVRASRQTDFQVVARLVKDLAVERIIVGLPLSLNGTEGPQARQVRRYTEQLAQSLSVPVEFWDERYSSVTAADFLRVKGQRRQQMRDKIDAVAAAVILQSYLDAQAPVVGE